MIVAGQRLPILIATKPLDFRCGQVISPFLTGCIRRIHAAIFSFMAGVMPPMPLLGRSLL
jgi:hypothetical protein